MGGGGTSPRRRSLPHGAAAASDSAEAVPAAGAAGAGVGVAGAGASAGADAGVGDSVGSSASGCSPCGDVGECGTPVPSESALSARTRACHGTCVTKGDGALLTRARRAPGASE